jgi:hypothetical protein
MKIIHDLERNLTPGSTYKYKCQRCQQEWKTSPTSKCPGVKVFFSRDPNDCPQQYRTLVELEAKGMQPVDKDQPIAAFRTSRQGSWVFLYDETKAIPKRRSEVILGFLKGGFRLFAWLVNVVAGALIAVLLGLNPAPRSLKDVLLMVFVLQHSLLSLIITCGIVLLTLIGLLLFLRLRKPNPQPVLAHHLHPWSLVTIASTASFLLCFSLLITVILHPSWCSTSLCPAPQPLLHPGGNNDTKLEIYPIALQSTWYVVPSDPTRCRQNQLLDCIGALKTDGQSSPPPYHLILGLHSLQEGRFGMTIEEIKLVVQEVSPIPRPLNAWNKLSLIDYGNSDQYQAAYTGQEAGTMLPAEYLRFKNGFEHLNPGETNPIDIHLISRVEAHIQFSVQVLYRVDNESRSSSLRLSLPHPFEVVFADASNWHLYHLQGEHFVANS